jgi:uncharacterized protein (TIGR02453 family)
MALKMFREPPSLSRAVSSKSSSILTAKPYFDEAGLRFLRSLKRNNRREWFEAHKPEFEQSLKAPMLALIEVVNRAMEDFAPAHVRPPQKCMMRIYRDIRFSPDKRPYKSHVSAWWSREGLEKTSGGGYYMQVSGDEVLVAAGVYMPERDQLLAIRNYLVVHHEEVRRLLHAPRLRKKMQPIDGLALTRPPKGFVKGDPAMDLLVCRQWGVHAQLPVEVALKKNFAQQVSEYFRLAAPLVDALNEPLTAAAARSKRPLFGFAVARNRRETQEGG